MAKFRESFKKRADFLRLKDCGASFVARFFIANAAPAREIPARYGITASLSTFDNSVKRNRARRLMREWLRLEADALDPGKDYSFVLRAAILNAKREEGVKELKKVLEKLI
ncbi:MAG: ribonuclease P protein component [Alphaproteobacteria bacterium]|nr:ribonuclease P protein component [Alphaproteobacteria bacterium]